jgi:FlaA1/EpsC-like NDP-sugar epimerase
MRFSYLFVAQAMQGTTEPERALICGTANEARHALGRLRRNGTRQLEPIGFVEFRPRWQGNQVARLPVLGTLEMLPEIVGQHRVRHLVIADPRLQGQSLNWVRAVCRQLDVSLHHYVEQLVADADLPGIPHLAREVAHRDAADTRTASRKPSAGQAGARTR